MKIILLGSPGAGKGTQSMRLTQHFNIPHISTGDILRAEVKAASPLGKKVKAVMDAGELVSDELIIELVKHRIEQSDCQNGFLFDGIPRTLAQAEALKSAKINIDYVIEIVVDDEEIIRRLTGRLLHQPSGRTYHAIFNPPSVAGKDDVTDEALIQREDDREESVRKRLEVYHQQTKPLVEYYQQLAEGNTQLKYVRVNGSQNIDEVTAEIYSALSESQFLEGGAHA